MLRALIFYIVVLAPIPQPRLDPMGRGFLGVRVMDGQLAISVIEPDSAAEAVGLKPGDVFVKVSDVEITNYEQVKELIKMKRPGAILNVEMKRGNERLTFAATLMARSELIDP